MMTCDQNRITAAVHAWIAGHPMSEGENEFVGMREVAAFVRSLPRRVANDGFAYVTLESNGRQILFAQRASSAFFGPEYLLFGQIELAYNELVSLLQVGLTCVSYVVSHQL